MSNPAPRQRQSAPTLLTWLGVSLVCVLAMWGMVRLVVVQRLEQRCLDWRFTLRGPRESPASSRVLLVTIDDGTLQRMKKPQIDWGEDVARLITRLQQMQARAIGVDLPQPISLDAVEHDYDRKLAVALHDAGTVTLIGLWQRQPAGGQKLLEPTDRVKSALPDAEMQIGFGDFYPESDTVVRTQLLADVDTERKQLCYSFAAILAARALHLSPDMRQRSVVLGDWSTPLTMPINYIGPSHAFASIPFATLAQNTLSRQSADRLAQQVKGKIILIGTDYTGSDDLHRTPYSLFQGPQARAHMAGVEIQANALATLLDHRPLVSMPSWAGWVIIAVLGFLLSALCVRRRLLHSLLLVLLVAAAWTLLAVVLFHADIVLPMAAPLLTMLLVFGVAATSRALRDRAERRHITALLGRFVSSEVLEALLVDPHELDLGGDRCPVTVLFADIRGFTAYCEHTDEHEVVRRLNEFFQAMVPIVMRYHGTIDKYLGDGLMAIFGAPLPLDDHARSAVCCALEMRQALDALKERWGAHAQETFDIGIGIHSGLAVVGHIGVRERMEYTVIGTTVNHASRIEGATKQLGEQLLISEDTYQAVTDWLQVEGPYQLQVKDTPVTVYNVPPQAIPDAYRATSRAVARLGM